jgi:hypothetical protein
MNRIFSEEKVKEESSRVFVENGRFCFISAIKKSERNKKKRTFAFFFGIWENE